ncbi:MAG: hypothetical protein J5I65_15375 [Aridibacter famidurans]|nr:hypothetical protein [Aridibacter famidurans]
MEFSGEEWTALSSKVGDFIDAFALDWENPIELSSLESLSGVSKHIELCSENLELSLDFIDSWPNLMLELEKAWTAHFGEVTQFRHSEVDGYAFHLKRAKQRVRRVIRDLDLGNLDRQRLEKLADEFLLLIKWQRLLPTFINPTEDGGLSMEFYEGKADFLLEFYSPSEIVFLSKSDGGPTIVENITEDHLASTVSRIARSNEFFLS